MSKTVLVVDDEAAVRRFVARLLGGHGFAAIHCASVREAIALIASPEVAFDVVLTDLVMPDGEGAEVAAHVERCRPSTPVVFMSGHTLGDLHPDELPKGGQTFLTKPFTREQLINAIASSRSPAAA